MSGLLKLSVLFCVTLTFLQVNGSTHEIWQKFKQTHSKDYHPHLESKRRIVFEANVQAIADHNIKADLGLATFKQGLNPYTDIPHDEFVKTVNGYKKSRNSELLSNVQEHQVESLQLPNEVDWVKKGLVSSVKNQGSCGSCWTFSTAGAVEGAYALKTGKLEPLSQQHLLDCSVDGNYGCDGGEPAIALQWVVDNNGLDKEGCYSYKGTQGKCRPVSSCLSGKIKSYKRVPKGDEVALKEALSRVGPISIAIDASHESLQNYDSGVYSEKNCDPEALDHAILLVGYGTEDGQDYWKIKNSWGTYWGEGGYFKMARNKGNMCGVATEAFYGVA